MSSTWPTPCARSRSRARPGIDPRLVSEGIARTGGVPGRLERIDAGQDFLAFVDYAHKPDAVEAALAAVRPLTRGRLVLVIGAGGDRDIGKRPVMGAIGARLADVLVVTDDNPRTEDPAAIRAAVLEGARTVEGAEVLEIGDRREAIRHAVASAGPGDTVVIAGKGHETGQEIQGTVHPFDDRDELRAALGGRRMIPLSLGEIAALVGGEVADGDADTRGHGAGVPRQPPPRAAGAVRRVRGRARRRPRLRAPVRSREVPPACSARRATGVPTVVVADVQAALQELARQVLRRLWESDPGPKVIAITGSQGKTTAKDMLARVLADAAPTVATAGSFNNELGPAAHRAAGHRPTPATSCWRWGRAASATSPSCARSRRPTSRWCSTSARPTSASSGPRSRSRWPRASSSRRCRTTATPCSTPTTRWWPRWPHARAASVVTFGRPRRRRTCSDDVEVDDLGRAVLRPGHDGATSTSTSASSASTRRRTPPPRPPRRWPPGSRSPTSPRACARSTGSRRGGWRSTSAPTAWSWSTTPTTPTPTRWPPRSRRSPGWVERGGRRTVAVLGEMRELGASAEEEHRAVGALAHRLGIDEVVVVGEGARAIHEAVARRARRRRHDAPRRDRRTGRRVVARQCGGSRRRPGQGVPGRAARTGRRPAAGGAPRTDPTDDEGEESGR